MCNTHLAPQSTRRFLAGSHFTSYTVSSSTSDIHKNLTTHQMSGPGYRATTRPLNILTGGLLIFHPLQTPSSEWGASYLPPRAPIAADTDIYTMVTQVVGRQLQESEHLTSRRALHFQPPHWPHPVTVVLPLSATLEAAAATEDALQPRRLELHHRLSAPPPHLPPPHPLSPTPPTSPPAFHHILALFHCPGSCSPCPKQQIGLESSQGLLRD